MELRTRDGEIELAVALIVCDLEKLAATLPRDDADLEGELPAIPWATTNRAVIAYSAEDRMAIEKASLDGRIPYAVEIPAPPDAERLARARSAPRTRTEALAYLGEFWVGCTASEATAAALEYNRTAAGVVAESAAERDEAAQRLTDAGSTPILAVAKRPPPTPAELDERLREVESREIEAPRTPSET